MRYSNLLIHIPHASKRGVGKCGWPETEEFRKVVDRWTDWETDKLFDFRVLNSGLMRPVRIVRFPLSRFVVDVERLPDDPLEAIGQGRIYRRFGELERVVTKEEEVRLLRWYDRHMTQVMAQLSPETLLMDCHSFPSDLSDVDVCIGLNDDWSRPPQEVIDLIVSSFEDAGYKVGVNRPYQNSLSPRCGFDYHSVMIELNKRTYWNESCLIMTDNAARIHNLLIDLCIMLMSESWK